MVRKCLLAFSLPCPPLVGLCGWASLDLSSYTVLTLQSKVSQRFGRTLLGGGLSVAKVDEHVAAERASCLDPIGALFHVVIRSTGPCVFESTQKGTVNRRVVCHDILERFRVLGEKVRPTRLFSVTRTVACNKKVYSMAHFFTKNLLLTWFPSNFFQP